MELVAAKALLVAIAHNDDMLAPDAAIISFAFSLLIIMARFARLAASFLTQLFGKNLIGSLRKGGLKSRPPQALPQSE